MSEKNIAKLEEAGKGKFNFYYPNVHPDTGEVTEGIYRDKTLKEIKDFAKKRDLEKVVLEIIKQTSSSITQTKKAKKQVSKTKTLEKWKLGKYFGKSDELRLSGKKWFKKGFAQIGTPSRTYLDAELSEKIFSESGLEYLGYDLFYDHDKKVWAAKKLGVRNAKKLNEFLVN